MVAGEQFAFRVILDYDKQTANGHYRHRACQDVDQLQRAFEPHAPADAQIEAVFGK